MKYEYALLYTVHSEHYTILNKMDTLCQSIGRIVLLASQS